MEPSSTATHRPGMTSGTRAPVGCWPMVSTCGSFSSCSATRAFSRQRYLNVTDEELRRGLEVSWINQGRPLRAVSGN